MWFEQYRCQIFTLLFVLVYNGCEAISNASFNDQIRDYVINDGNQNVTNVKTLQKEHNIGLAGYASYTPPQNNIQYTEVPDSVLSGSSHGRGLLHHDNAGYGRYEFEDPHYTPYEYQPEHYDHDYHHYIHEPHHHTGHHVAGYGHHYKHYDHHSLATKAILWPIAGIALLGAAAALVSNPVLLQLGVATGRKKRQAENLDFVKDSIKTWTPKPMVEIGDEIKNIPELIVKRRFIKNDDTKVKPVGEDGMKHNSKSKILTVLSRRYTDEDERRMIPVPLLRRKPLNIE